MEFACRGRPTADQDGGDSSRRFPDPPPPHGDAMLVIRDALLSQLQKDRLRQEIIITELARLERAMALSSAARHGIDAAYVEQPKRPFFTSSEEFMTHLRWMENFSDVNEVHDLKKNDVKHGNVQLKSVNPAAGDRFSVCLRPCCSNSKADEKETFDEQKLQESNEPTKMSPSLKWELTGITIPVKKPKQPKSWSCDICQVEAPDTEHSIKVHCAGKKHRSNVASLESRNKTIIQKAEITAESSCAAQKTSAIIWSCNTCQANGTSEAELKEHLSGKTHQQNIKGQCQEGDGMAKNDEPQEANRQESKLPQLSEKPPCTICQDNCTTKSGSGSLLLAKIQTLLDAIDNMAMNSESHEAKSPPNNMPQDAEQTSQSNCSICQTGSGYQSCCSEPQSENPRKIRKRRKKRGTLQVEGQDAEPGDRKSAGTISSDGYCSKSASSEEKQASYLCEVCNLDLNSESRLAEHCNGEEHLEKQRLLNFCEVCNLQCNSRKVLDDHRTGKKHQKNLDANK